MVQPYCCTRTMIEANYNTLGIHSFLWYLDTQTFLFFCDSIKPTAVLTRKEYEVLVFYFMHEPFIMLRISCFCTFGKLATIF